MNKSLKKARTDLEASELVDKLGRISFTVMLIPLQLGLRASRPSTVGVTHKSQVDISSDPERVRTVKRRPALPSRPGQAWLPSVPQTMTTANQACKEDWLAVNTVYGPYDIVLILCCCPLIRGSPAG